MTHKFFALAVALGLSVSSAYAIEQAQVTRSDAQNVTINWQDKDPVSVYVSTDPDAPVSAATLVAKDQRKGVLKVASAPGERQYYILQDKGDASLVRVAERVLPLEQGSNFRDLGGYETTDGKHVRWGMIYRSGGTPMLTKNDLAFIDGLHLANMVDLRSSEEQMMAPTRISGVNYATYRYSMAGLMSDAMKKAAQNGGSMDEALKDMNSMYRGLPMLLKPQMKLVFQGLLKKEGPLAYNCSAGQDRTGFASALILSALGVPRETIYQDYVLSTPSRRPQWEMPPISAEMAASSPIAGLYAEAMKKPEMKQANPLVTADGTPFLKSALEEIDGKWGSVEGYLEQEIGLSKLDIAQLRATYLQ